MMLSEKLFLILLFILIFLEGFGLPYGHEIGYFLVIISPIFIFYLDKSEKFVWKVPREVVLFLSVYLFLSFFSTVFSIDIDTSIEKNIQVLSGFVYFIYIYNHRSNLHPFMGRFFVSIGIFVSIYSSLINIFPLFFKYLMPTNTFQYVYSVAGNHNHLGDFLLIPVVYIFYEYFNKKDTKYLICLPVFILLIILSYSRSAYLSLSLVLIYLLIHYWNSIGSKWLITIFISFMCVLIFALYYFPLQKALFGDRDLYFKQGIASVKDNPILGVGYGNFSLISNKYSNRDSLYDDGTTTSHNILFDHLVEGGIFMGILVSLAFAIFLINGIKNWYYFAFFALFINFMLDYTFNIYSIMIVFSIFCGFIYQAKIDIVSNIYFQKIILGCCLFGIYLMISNLIIILNIKSYWVFYFNPINKVISRNVIDQAIVDKNHSQALGFIKFTSNIHQGDVAYMEYLASVFEKFGNKKTAALYYKKACEADTVFNCMDYFKKIYYLDKGLYQDTNFSNRFDCFLDSIYKAFLDYKNNSKDKVPLRFLRNIISKTVLKEQTYAEYINMAVLICKEVYPNCKYQYLERSF